MSLDSLNPFSFPGGPVPLTLAAAYKSWAHWCALCGVGGLQLAHVHAARERLDDASTLNALSEVLARATMEVAIGLTCDSVDTGVDLLVAEQIRELFGRAVALQVLASVRAAGGPVRVTPMDLEPPALAHRGRALPPEQ